ncbi:Triose phosphate/phosphate translocator, partial [Durusdinium trenchii]
MTISALQLGVGCIYALFMWVAPDARAAPKVTLDDIVKMLPVAFCFMGAHSASVFALSAGAVSFGQIVKAAEPAFAAVLSQFVYKKQISKAKWMCLPIVIGGVILASVKELDFAVSALISACIANLFALRSEASSDAVNTRGGAGALGGIDIPLLLYFLFWYVGNYYYNITNKLALRAAGGSTGFPMTISALQLGVGCIYALFMWVAPDARAAPKVTLDDIVKMLPVAFCFMGAHSASVFALSAGAVSFGQIVKAAEPAFAAVLSQFVYKKQISKAKWMCLPIVIGGVILASVKELDFAVSALISACIANLFAAFKGNENKKLMETSGLKERMGSVGNQF